MLISSSSTFQSVGYCKMLDTVINEVNLLFEWNSLYPAMLVA